MSDGEEKSFPASPRKRAEARKKGQVAKTPELATSAVLLALVSAMHVALPGYAGQSLISNIQSAFAFNPANVEFNFNTVHLWQERALLWTGRIVLPALLLAMVLGVVANVAQVGFEATPESLAPKWDRVNPVNGLKRLFSARGFVELAKGIAKMAIVGGICYSAVRGAIEDETMIKLMGVSLSVTMSTVGALLWTIGIRVSVWLFLLAVADYAYQKYDLEKNLKMTLTEVKDEMKQSEGDPQMKAKVRRMQREMAGKRMMKDVPTADVVVTNPTHFAVALKYDEESGAPIVVAKGQDLIAQKIKEIARENRVPIVENRPLARKLHKAVEIGQQIPGDLYEAVAQVLAFVYRTYGRRRR
jgi:flagellar biosynthetic protein FlhB